MKNCKLCLKLISSKWSTETKSKCQCTAQQHTVLLSHTSMLILFILLFMMLLTAYWVSIHYKMQFFGLYYIRRWQLKLHKVTLLKLVLVVWFCNSENFAFSINLANSTRQRVHSHKNFSITLTEHYKDVVE